MTKLNYYNPPEVNMKWLSNHGETIIWVYIFYPYGSRKNTEGDVFWDREKAWDYFFELRKKHSNIGAFNA